MSVEKGKRLQQGTRSTHCRSWCFQSIFFVKMQTTLWTLCVCVCVFHFCVLSQNTTECIMQHCWGSGLWVPPISLHCPLESTAPSLLMVCSNKLAGQSILCVHLLNSREFSFSRGCCWSSGSHWSSGCCWSSDFHLPTSAGLFAHCNITPLPPLFSMAKSLRVPLYHRTVFYLFLESAVCV